MDVANWKIIYDPLHVLVLASRGSAKSTKSPTDDGNPSWSLPLGLLIQHSAGSEDNTAVCSIVAVDSAINNLEGELLLRAEVRAEDNNTGPMMVHAPAQPPRRRNRFRFSKKRFVARSEFYLQPHHGFPNTTTTTFPDLVGVIEKCPIEKTNESNYIVRWSYVHQSKAPVPGNLIPHLRTRYPKDFFKFAFRELIESFEKSGSAAILPSNPLVVTAAANIILAAVATPPSMFNQTRAALSAIYTAGTSGRWSTMSSLGRSQRSLFHAEEEEELHACNDGDVEDNDDENNEEEENNCENVGDVVLAADDSNEHGHNDHHGSLPIPPVSTRTRKRKRARDSDDDVTEGEDDHQLDREQNFWEHRDLLWRQMQEQEEAYQSNLEDGEDEDDIVAPTEDPFDVATLLSRATDFGFKELDPAEAAALPEPPKIYDAPFGIKEGIAEQIKTPLDAFRMSGFTENMLISWVKNSNK